MQSEYEISTLYQEAQSRWLKPPEVHFILQNHQRYELTHMAPHKPTSGSLYLFNRRVLKFFRKDGHQWRRKQDGRAVAEAHERLKVGNVEALNCYYAHGEHDLNFQRRIYWMLDPGYDHIVLVHYRDINDFKEGRQTSGTVLQFSQNAFTLLSSPSSIGTHNPSYNHYNGVSTSTSPGIGEVNSKVFFNSKGVEIPEGSGSSYEFENRQAIKRLEEQLSLGDDIEACMHTVLQGRQSSETVLQFSQNASTLFSSTISIGNASYNQQHSSTTSSSIAEVNSGVVFNSNGIETPEGSASSYEIILEWD